MVPRLKEILYRNVAYSNIPMPYCFCILIRKGETFAAENEMPLTFNIGRIHIRYLYVRNAWSIHMPIGMIDIPATLRKTLYPVCTRGVTFLFQGDNHWYLQCYSLEMLKYISVYVSDFYGEITRVTMRIILCCWLQHSGGTVAGWIAWDTAK